MPDMYTKVKINWLDSPVWEAASSNHADVIREQTRIESWANEFDVFLEEGGNCSADRSPPLEFGRILLYPRILSTVSSHAYRILGRARK